MESSENPNPPVEPSSASSKFQDIEDFFETETETFQKFDEDRDGKLSFQEFSNLCQAVFRMVTSTSSNETSAVEPPLPDQTIPELFKIFDVNSDDFIDSSEFAFCFEKWISPILRPRSALIIVDVQNDFINGSLALKNSKGQNHGQEVIPPINKMLREVPFDAVFYTLDWHPPNHLSFIDNLHLRKLDPSMNDPDISTIKTFDTVIFDGPQEQRLWPRHCVQNTLGAELHADLLKISGSNSQFIYKGQNPEVDSYSAFLDNDKRSLTPLKQYLEEAGVTLVFVCGLALDVCVAATAVDSLNLGFRTVLVEDASRGVTSEGVEEARGRVEGNGGVIVLEKDVKAMVEGLERKVELALFLARKLKGVNTATAEN